MTQITEDSNVQIRNPVANRADFDGHKKKGTFGWATDQAAPVFCPEDDANYIRLSVHPDDAPVAGTLNSGDTILVSVGGTLKKTTVLAIGGGGAWQPLDSDLTAIAALTTQAFGRSLLTQSDAAAVRTLIGAPSAADLTGYQPLDSDLTAIAALTTQAFGRSLLTQSDAVAVRTLIGAGTSSFNGAYASLSAIPAPIAALDDLTPAADRLPYFTGASAASVATFTAFARTLLDDADAATARATLGAGTVSSVGLSMPTGFTVASSPVTGSGTLAVTMASQVAGKVFASPGGVSGAPSFISLTQAHIPLLDWSKITTGLPTTLVGYGITDAQPLDADLTAIAGLTTTGFLQRTGTNTWTLVAAATPAAHEASHRAGGPDQLKLTDIFGGRTVDTPQFAGLALTSGITFNGDHALSSNNTDGNEQTAISLAGGGAATSTRGAYVTARGNERPSSGGSLTLAAGDGIQGLIDMQTGGSSRLSITKTGEVAVSVSLSLGNLANTQIPVANSSKVLVGSGLTDDGTFLGISRTIRAWDSMARSGNTWTDLQWTQDAQQRVSMLGSNGSGGNAYHILTFVSNDTEATERDLGYISYGQKVSGKSGSSPGIKIDMFGRALGAGGSVGGFGGQWGINYRPDNGSALIPALRVGAFGGGVQDAVEAAILLRAAAGLSIAGLGSSGALGVDASGNVVLQQSVRFQALAASVTGDYVERSVLGQSSAKRLIPANSIASGDVLEIVEDFVFYWGGNSTTWDFYVGPDGTYTSPYRLSYTITAPDLGSQGYTRRCKVALTARFFGSGASVTAKVNIEISACDDNSYSGTLVHKEINFTLAIDNSADRYFDLTVAAGPGSTWSNHLVSATYRKAA